MTADTEPTTPETETFFVIEGPLSRLRGSRSVVNLLKERKLNTTGKTLATGVVGAVSGMANLTVNAVLLRSYKGETIYDFSCRLGEHILIGRLPGLHLLDEGDHLKAAVSRRIIPNKGEVLYAHALLRPKDELLWLPFMADHGSRAMFWEQMKFGFFISVFVLTLLMMVMVFQSDFGFGLFKKTLPYMALGVLLIFSIGLWVYSDLKPFALYANRIFTALGFPDVKNLDMRSASYDRHHGTLYVEQESKSVFYYQAALNAHRTGTKVKINVPSIGLERRKQIEAMDRQLEEQERQEAAERDAKRLRLEERRRQAQAKRDAKEQRALERQRRKEEKARNDTKPKARKKHT